jgi:hypothetical protein
MLIDFNIKEWKPNYLAFKDAGNVPPALTQLQTTDEQMSALGRRYVNPLGETFIYVKCDCSRGRPIIADLFSTISVAANTLCWVEDIGSATATPAATTRQVYNLYGSNEATGEGAVVRHNALALYGFVSTKPASGVLTVAWGLVKLLPSMMY